MVAMVIDVRMGLNEVMVKLLLWRSEVNQTGC